MAAEISVSTDPDWSHVYIRLGLGTGNPAG